MPFRVTFFFESVQPANIYASAALGWTESFYMSGAGLVSIDAALNHVDVLNYVALRRAFMPPAYRISWVRVADTSNAHLYKVKGLAGQFGTVELIEDAVGQSQVQCAVLVDLARLPTALNEPTHHRKFLIRGLASDVINGNILNPFAKSFGDLKVFLNWLAFKEAGVLIVAPPPAGAAPNSTRGVRYQDPAQAWTAVLSAQADATKRNVIVKPMQAAPAGGVGTFALRRFVSPLKVFNRHWRYLANDVAGQQTVLGVARSNLPSDIYNAPGAAQIKFDVYQYGLFNQYTIIGLRNKRTGRIFRQLRGKSASR